MTQTSLAGPPDGPGWWWIAIPGRDPFLMYVEEGEDYPLFSLWQQSFRRWRITEQGSSTRAENVLNHMAKHPSLLWEMICIMPHIAMAGPWKKGSRHLCRNDGMGEMIGWLDDGGEPTVNVTGRARNLPHENMNSQEEAKQVVDDYLRKIGYRVLND